MTETFATQLTTDSTVDVLSVANVEENRNLQENIRAFCVECRDIFNDLPAEPAQIEPFNLVEMESTTVSGKESEFRQSSKSLQSEYVQ